MDSLETLGNQRPQWLPAWAQSNTNRTKKLLVSFIVSFAVVLCFFMRRPVQVGWNGTYHPLPALDVTGSHGAVASDVQTCSQMGVEVLKAGGTAADAAVQVCLCIGTLEPQASGIGGGGFITLRYPNGTALVIDARETAPRNSSKHMFDDNPMLSKMGGLASAVPGELAGLEKLWLLAGRRPWQELVDPVADLNEHGFIRSEALKRTTAIFRSQLVEQNMTMFDELREVSDWEWLLDPKQSHIIKRPNLAKTLRAIAREGAHALYHGDIARKLVEITRKTGGALTEQDFADYEVVVREPLTTRFQNLTIITPPAPTSGPALVMGLNVLEQLLEARDDADPVMLQRMVETMKWMAAARSELGDPDFITNSKIEELITPEWAARVISQINDSHTLDSWRDYHPSYEMNTPHGTTHFSIVDAEGMAVSVTSTVNLWFGNFVCDPETGIIMNSEMDDFSVPRTKNSFELAPSTYNFVEPGKRPLSSTVPSILVNDSGEVELVIGAAGGSFILTSVFLTIVRIMGFDLPALEAVSYPRYHHQLIPEKLMVEPTLDQALVEAAQQRGHEVCTRIAGSALNAVHRSNGVWHAVSDYYRKRGLGAAY